MSKFNVFIVVGSSRLNDLEAASLLSLSKSEQDPLETQS